jgi:ABC-type sugar transport system substrate-binding protein
MGNPVGLFLIDLENDYQVRLREDALRRGKRLGLDIEVRLSGNDPRRQAAQIRAALDERAKTGLGAIIVSPVSEQALAPVARAAAEAGVDWVLLNRVADYLEDLRAAFPDRAIFSVAADQGEVGRIQGRQAAALAREGETVLCVTGPRETWSARRRLAGLDEVIGGRCPIEPIEADWTGDGARAAVERWLAGGRAEVRRVGAIVAQNDDMAMGSLRAAREAPARADGPPLAAVPVTGCDGSPRFGQRLVREGRLASTVAISSGAGPALDWIRRARDGGPRPPARVVIPAVSYPLLAELNRPAG